MRKVLTYSLLLILGLAGSQILTGLGASALAREAVQVLTMLALAFIMIHVGLEFEIDRRRWRTYAVDYGVAFTAAAFPWIFVSLYFVLVMSPPADWGSFDAWKEALLAGRFAAPTSAGILFSMLAAAGLSATWYYNKTRILAIVGLRWQLGVVVLVMVVLLWIAWRYLRRVRLPVTWPWVMAYAAVITAVSEVIYKLSKNFDDVVPVHIEVLLPAFVLGCVLAHRRPGDERAEAHDVQHAIHAILERADERRTATAVSSVFMVLVGLSMPPFLSGGGSSWQILALHVVAVTVLANLGKMFPLFVYRREASLRERLAIGVGMWPRGEVGAGVLVVSLSYGIGGDIVTVAALSLALNLMLTGVFILAVKRLLGPAPKSADARGAPPASPGEPAGSTGA
jgi:Kef-type K+ transport system membrane component KefB